MPTTQDNILNVTLLEPKQKHPTIFARYDQLKEGENLIIHNDHDPKPLYYQLLGERGNVFIWEYLEQGPAWWKVKITKKISGESDETLGEIAAKDLRKAEIFKRYGLDFSCNGKKTVKEACAEQGMDATQIEQELQQADRVPVSRPIPYDEWSTDFLADYILNTHHSYIKKNLPDMLNYAEKVMKVHGNEHPELIEINQLVNEMSTVLMTHIAREEKIIFPHIKELAQAKDASTKTTHADTLQSQIKILEIEHELMNRQMQEIKELSGKYTLPKEACASYNLLYWLLNEFEQDLQMHMHLENNILFPKTLESLAPNPLRK